MTLRYNYTIRVQKIDRGGYVAFAAALPGCQAYGETYEGALKAMPSAIQDFVALLRSRGHRLPVEERQREIGIEVELPDLPTYSVRVTEV